MEFRQLRYFLAIVEAGSVSAASRRIHVAQPALTRQIKLLEEDLNTRLFERHARGMVLTMAGRALVEEAKELLTKRDELRGRLASLGSGTVGRLSIGITPTYLWQSWATTLLRNFRRDYPGIALEIFPLLSGPQLERLRDNSLEAGLMYLHHDDEAGISSMEVHRDTLILAMPMDSEWVSNPPDSLSQLSNADFIWGFRWASPSYYDRMIEHFHHLGFQPKVVQYGADNSAILSMVSAGLGLAIVPDSASANPVPGICFLRLPELDACDMPLRFAWSKDNDSPILANMVHLVQEHVDFLRQRQAQPGAGC
ncbi:LysR family transcriptional regulator [Halomonas binhaiensis]|uniref:LysR family transcriptional regulator n=1 Tax=Halomonas binhaiensis TaxID=2562282 RepID=A0A5C1NGN8_9GAMM|nr:LysR family transcriptional regulator [Halomonas binhaiensis]QEM82031.1 LysR family transcriptional regulator [Halomonas binhaiensis]